MSTHALRDLNLISLNNQTASLFFAEYSFSTPSDGNPLNPCTIHLFMVHSAIILVVTICIGRFTLDQVKNHPWMLAEVCRWSWGKNLTVGSNFRFQLSPSLPHSGVPFPTRAPSMNRLLSFPLSSFFFFLAPYYQKGALYVMMRWRLSLAPWLAPWPALNLSTFHSTVLSLKLLL